MFSPYSQCMQHVRLVASEHPSERTTWQKVARQCHDADAAADLCGSHSRNPVVFIRYQVMSVAMMLQPRRRPAVNNRPAPNLAGGN